MLISWHNYSPDLNGKQETLRKVDEIFGPNNKDLFSMFQDLLGLCGVHVREIAELIYVKLMAKDAKCCNDLVL